MTILKSSKNIQKPKITYENPVNRGFFVIMTMILSALLLNATKRLNSYLIP